MLKQKNIATFPAIPEIRQSDNYKIAGKPNLKWKNVDEKKL